MLLGDYARIRNIQYRTAWNRFKRGEIPGAYKNERGTIIIPESAFTEHELTTQPPTKDNPLRCAIYARVSDPKKKEQLDAQAQRMVDFATSNGWQVVRVAKERGSGLNDNRKVLNSVLNTAEKWDILLVEHKDRLTRYGFNHIELLLNKLHRRVIVANTAQDNTTDLMNDLISVVYSFSARLYGQRRKERARAIVEVIKQ